MSLQPDCPECSLESRVLLLTPTRRDAQITSHLLLQAGLYCHTCDKAASVADQMEQGAGAILLTEEAIFDPSLPILVKALKSQPEWSDIPLVLLSKSPAEIVAQDNPLFGLTNVTFVERPAPIRSVISAVESAVRAREWQYQIRNKMQEIAQVLESERFARSEAERATNLKDEFLATLSHELRTPLSAILGWSYLIQKSPDNPAIVSDGGQIIARSGEALRRLVEDLLDLSRITSGKFRLDIRDVLLGPLVRETAASFLPAAKDKGVDLETQIADEPKPMRGDTARLQQVVSNLLSNAIRFTPRGGKISVSLTHDDEGALLEVTDTGEGISSDFLPHLFDRFRQADASTARRHGGMGIGLSLVKQFTELHGGVVTVKSDGAGSGSTFTIRLPFDHPLLLEEASVGHPTGGPSLEGHSVLVVDDDKGVRDFLSRLLIEGGATTRVASSVDDAIREMEESPPELLISDIGMPIRDGYELIRHVRAAGLTMPAIALTAFARKQDQDRVIAAGYQYHMAKPIEPGRLLQLISSAINGTSRT